MINFAPVHDVLPGSAIGMVYEDAEKLYAEVAKDGKRMFEDAVSSYMPGLLPLSVITQPSSSGTQTPKVPNGRLVALNTVHHSRREIVEIPLRGPSAIKLKSEVVQVSKDGSKAYVMMHSEENNGGLLWAEGLYADLKPASGMYLLIHRKPADVQNSSPGQLR